MNYRFENVNGGFDIINPVVRWTFAGFNIEGDGLLTVQIELKTDTAKFNVELSKVGKATDRSDAAIEQLMNYLLQPYIV
jgi:hypothetical protein